MPGPANLPTEIISDPSGDSFDVSTPSSITAPDGSVLLFIPEGPFQMGDSDMGTNPTRTITLSGFYISQNLVTVAQYKAYCTANNLLMPEPPPWGFIDDHPMVNVNWWEAHQYAEWAGLSLPTEAQWEKAARGDSGLLYPWGNTFQPTYLQSKNLSVLIASTSPVGTFTQGASPYGINDMAGNVNEWTNDWYKNDYYRLGPDTDPPGYVRGDYKVVRGGSWYNSDATSFRASLRTWQDPRARSVNTGFRLVSSLPAAVIMLQTYPNICTQQIATQQFSFTAITAYLPVVAPSLPQPDGWGSPGTELINIEESNNITF